MSFGASFEFSPQVFQTFTKITKMNKNSKRLHASIKWWKGHHIIGAFSGPQQIMNLYDSLPPYSSLFFFRVPNENTWTCTQWKGKIAYATLLGHYVHCGWFCPFLVVYKPNGAIIKGILVGHLCCILLLYSSMCQQQPIFLHTKFHFH